MYGYPFQQAGRVEKALAYQDAPPKLLSFLYKLMECTSHSDNYNFQCFPWYIGGQNVRGMYLTYPGFNGDSEYVIGLCQFFESSYPNEKQFDRQLCNAIRLNELNDLVKKLAFGFDYYYILDRQLQFVAMHSNVSFANITSGKVTWESIELDYFNTDEKESFLSQIPEIFYSGKTEADFEEVYEGEKAQDKYFVGSFQKQGIPYMYVAYQMFVLDTTLDDVLFNYENRMYKKTHKYKSYYTLFNVINENTLFASYYKLEQDIENIYFILLWIQIATSIMMIIYSISVTFELANSLAESIEIIIDLLRTFKPEDHSDFSVLKSILSPLDQIRYIFCFEIDQIYESFKSLMHIITFRNKTTSISTLSDGQTLLDWVFACSFFQNMTGNHTFLGISYNNLGNIHFNSHRYLEACQCYHVSIIHVNYLLNELDNIDGRYTSNSIHSQQGIQQRFSNNNREFKGTSNIREKFNTQNNREKQNSNNSRGKFNSYQSREQNNSNYNREQINLNQNKDPKYNNFNRDQKYSNYNRDQKNSSLGGDMITYEGNAQNQQNQQQFQQARKTKATSIASILSRFKKRVSSIPFGLQSAANEQIENQVQYINPVQQYQDLLHLKFERLYQYIRAQKMYFLQTQPQMRLWKEQIHQLKDLFHLDQNLSPPSPSRTVMILLELSFCYLMKKKLNKSHDLINLSLALFVQNSSSQNVNLNNPTQYQIPRNLITTNNNINTNFNEAHMQKNGSLGNSIQPQFSKARERTKTKRNQTIFSESQQVYLNLLQQTCPVLKNPYLQKMVNDLNRNGGNQEDFLMLESKQTQRKFNEQPTSRNKVQSNHSTYNINAAIEMIGLNKQRNPNQKFSIISGQRRTNMTSISSNNNAEKSFSKTKQGSDFMQQNNENNIFQKVNCQIDDQNLTKQEQNNSNSARAQNQIKINIYNQQETNNDLINLVEVDEYQTSQNIEPQTLPKETDEVFIGEQINFPMHRNSKMNQLEKQYINNDQQPSSNDQKIFSQPNLTEDIEINTPPISWINSCSRNSLQQQINTKNQLLYDYEDKQNYQSNLQNEIQKNKNNQNDDQNKQELSPQKLNKNYHIRKQAKKTTLELDNLYIEKQINPSLSLRKSTFFKLQEYESPQLSQPQDQYTDRGAQNLFTEKNINLDSNSNQAILSKAKELSNQQNSKSTEFPSNVIISKIMLSLADLFKQQGDYTQAVLMATNSLEASTQYFALYRYESLQLINSCFSQLQIKSKEVANYLNKFNPQLFMKLSIIIDYGNFQNSHKISKILRELFEQEMKNSKDSIELLLAREYCETLISPIYKDQYVFLKQNINTIINSLPQKIRKLSKASQNNRVNLFKPLTKILAQYQINQILNSQSSNQNAQTQIFQANMNSEGNIQSNQPSTDKLQMKVVAIFTDMTFPIRTIYNSEINQIFQNNSIHLIIYDVTDQSIYYPSVLQQTESFEYVHLFSQPLQLINFFSNLREKTSQLGEPTFVQIL